MSTISQVLLMIATEIAENSKAQLPALQNNETIVREYLRAGVLYRETVRGNRQALYQYDFRQRKVVQNGGERRQIK